jgi:hypothetical protein
MGDLSNPYTDRLKDDTVMTSILEIYHLAAAEEKLLENVYPWERNALGFTALSTLTRKAV